MHGRVGDPVLLRYCGGCVDDELISVPVKGRCRFHLHSVVACNPSSAVSAPQQASMRILHRIVTDHVLFNLFRESFDSWKSSTLKGACGGAIAEDQGPASRICLTPAGNTGHIDSTAEHTSSESVQCR